jgi:two-component system, OmpR family, KDP operon response regulator KdpE
MGEQHMKVLIVEDDITTIESIKLCLEIYEPDSKLAYTHKGQDALQMLRDGGYDGVIIDLGLPDIDGAEVLKELRTFSNIPAVVLSARQSPEVIRKALEYGANDYITKPFEYKNLLKRLNQLIADHAR